MKFMQKFLYFKLNKLILCVIFFLPLCIIFFSGNSIFTVNDDFAVVALLKSGEPHVLLMSYPLSSLLVYLYKTTPLVPWYSLTLTSFLVFSSIIYFKALNLILKKSINFYLLFFIIGIIFYSFIFKNISITITTLVSFATSFLFLLFKKKIRIFLFSVSVFLSFLLRDFYFILFIFYIFVLLMLFVNKKILNFEYLITKKDLFIIFLPFIVILLNNYGYSSRDYKEWVDFNIARGIQSDFIQFAPEDNKLLNQENLNIFRLWYPYDQEIIPTETIIKISGSLFQIYKKVLSKTDIKNFLKTKTTLYYKYFLFFVFILIIVLLKSKKNKFIEFYICFVANMIFIWFIFLIILVRDVERVTIGLFFVVLCFDLIFVSCYCSSNRYCKFHSCKKYDFLLFLFLFVSLVAFWGNDFRYTLLNQNTKNTFEKELKAYKEFRKGYEGYTFIPCVLMPYFMCNFFVVQNFHENDSIGNFTTQNFFPVGWLARSPFYYRKLHEKGFDRFYDFMMHEKALFFGGNIICPEFNAKYLQYLDSNFGNNEYKHEIKTLKKNDLFSLSKIVKVKK